MVLGFTGAALGLAWLTQIGAHTSFASHVLPAEILISVGMGLAFVPDEQHSPVRGAVPRCRGGQRHAQHHPTDRRLARDSPAQHRLRASTTAAYLATRIGTPAVREAAQIHGYTVGFAIGAVFLAIAALSAAFLINAKREDMAAMDTMALAPA